METQDLDLLADLHALPETDPVGIDESYGGTCQCAGVLTILNTICIGITC
ncbi:VenA family class IV lanthipeptide [Streptomyces tsukubensis]|nr:VenA family class IV lanthipeptide [Streptomyces tsukubensis]